MKAVSVFAKFDWFCTWTFSLISLNLEIEFLHVRLNVNLRFCVEGPEKDNRKHKGALFYFYFENVKFSAHVLHGMWEAVISLSLFTGYVNKI